MQPILLPLLLISLLAVGCGDDPAPVEDTNNSTDYWLDDVDCPRLEMESFDDCTEESLRISLDYDDNRESYGDLERFCESTCRKSNGISVTNSSAVTDLRMLNGLQETYGLTVEDSGVVSLDGLQDLTRIERNLRLQTSSNLRDVSELESLKQVGQDIYIRDMGGLRSLQGLQSLEEVRYLTIELNDSLTSIEALQGLESLEGVTIIDNPKLPTCQAEQLVERLGVADEEVRIQNNGSGDCQQ